MFSVSAAPAKQSVGETITVLSGRLSSATLLEDRRAAILGLRSFAKGFPASVASGALRSLIGSLSKDGEDVDTVKVVLETLLMLFNPSEDSPEASEDIALWLADEFTQKQENITLLLNFLDTTDFYSRLYSLQLLTAILAARTERTEECVFTAPLGISRLVAVLDDRREALRNEAITLLTYLTPNSIEIQKLVAFENAFDRLFVIIENEGSLSGGGRTVEDCLILLANLLRHNASNQSLFRESGFVVRLAKLLENVESGGLDDTQIALWAQSQRNRNVYALLAALRLFLVPGAAGTPQSQLAFWQQGALYPALQLAFSRTGQNSIKAEALVVCADTIRGNSVLQESFAQLMVPSPLESGNRGKADEPTPIPRVYVIDGLLDLTLSVHSLDAFDIRMAACNCLKAYFFGHADIRLHFLRRAIEGHQSGADDTANILAVLLRPSTDALSINPYRSWFAAVIAFHLLFDTPVAKDLATAVTEGDASSGEEVVTSIQIITAHLISGLGREQDERITVGYLMLLLGWLFEDLDAVNDFLGEGTNVQSLIRAVIQPSSTGEIVPGLCAAVLGTVYEFSTRDSPITRKSLHSILMSRVGRDKYTDRLSRLRTHPSMRDFEVLPQKLDNSMAGKLPEVYFDSTFVEFFKDNYSRILRAIDRDPGMEIPVLTNGIVKGISRELVDSLRDQLAEKDQALQGIQSKLAVLGAQLSQEQADHSRASEAAALDLSKMKSANLELQQRHSEELQTLRNKIILAEQEHKAKMDQARRLAESDADRLHRRIEAEMADLRATISRLEVDLMKANKSKATEVQLARDEFQTKLRHVTSQLAEAETHNHTLEKGISDAKAERDQASSLLVQAEDAKKATQNELDDLLMVFGDLEDKVSKYKARLLALGEEVSDGEGGESGASGEESDGSASEVD